MGELAGEGRRRRTKGNGGNRERKENTTAARGQHHDGATEKRSLWQVVERVERRRLRVRPQAQKSHLRPYWVWVPTLRRVGNTALAVTATTLTMLIVVAVNS